MEKRNTKEHAETKVVANCDQLTNTEDTTLQSIQNRILTIRGKQVMLDRDLAVLYGVETRTLNQAVKRNIERFPEDFMFKLSKDEYNYWKSQTTTYNSSLKSQFVTSKTTLQSNGYSKNNSLKSQIVISNKGGDRSIPYAFTDNGVAMLSSVLRSKEAIILTTNSTHDRFLIIDDEVYLIGASIKDLGKKIFGFTKLEEKASELLKRLEE